MQLRPARNFAGTEQRVIRQALEQEKWNRARAARLLGISRRRLFDTIRQYGLREQGNEPKA